MDSHIKDFLRLHFEKTLPLTDAEFNDIASHFTMKKKKKHQFLVQEGDEVINDYLVVKGCLKAYHTDPDGKEHILQFAMEDWWITDYYGYFNQTKATIDIDCLEDCELLVLSLKNRDKLCNDWHGIANFFRRKSNAGYIALQQRILLLLNKNPQDRYNRLADLNPKLLQRVPKTLLAAYLGVSRETLSRLNHP